MCPQLFSQTEGRRRTNGHVLISSGVAALLKQTEFTSLVLLGGEGIWEGDAKRVFLTSPGFLRVIEACFTPAARVTTGSSLSAWCCRHASVE